MRTQISYGVIIIRWDVSLKKTLCLILIIAPMAMLVYRFAKDYQIAEIFGENFQVPQSYRYINSIKTIRKLLELRNVSVYLNNNYDGRK